MIEAVIEFSIRRRWLIIAAGVALALGGLWAASRTRIDAIPDLSENQIIVFTDWLGHSPREIEEQVTYPLSIQLQGLPGVRVVRTSSDFNFSMISVIFEEHVSVGSAREQVAARLSNIKGLLPDGVTPYLAPDSPATGQVFWYTLEGANHDLGQLRAVQDWYVRHQLAAVPGVAEVASVGGAPVEYQVEIDPARLAAHGVTLGSVTKAIAAANSSVGGHVIQKANAEYIVRGVGWIGSKGDVSGTSFDAAQAVRDLQDTKIRAADGKEYRIDEVATVSLGSQPRRGMLEKDGSEVVGGVVSMRYGENPLEVTRRIKSKIQQLQVGLPDGVRLLPMYDRTPLIHGAIRTVTGTLAEAMLTATICVLLVLMHLRTSLIVAVTLPLAALSALIILWGLDQWGWAEVQLNIMSLAGIVISIGVLVDSSIVVAENAMYRLKSHFGDRPVQGDTRWIVLEACRTVGKPIFFSVLIMLLSFLPVFALEGIEGKMFRPLALAKTFVMVAVAVLAITLVPALCTLLIKGRLHGERDNWLIRSVIDVYRPILDYMMDRPLLVVWLMAVTFLVGFAPLGHQGPLLGVLFVAMLVCGSAIHRPWMRAAAVASLILIALVAQQTMQRIAWDDMPPLDEGMVMDMPITVPRASITESADDLKARDMVLCRFPEVEMVVGKAGRAETATDPAPLDMIETMVSLRPQELWPKRKLKLSDVEVQAGGILNSLVNARIIEAPADDATRESLINESVMEVMPRFDALMREYCYQRNMELRIELGRELTATGIKALIWRLKDAGRVERPISDTDASAIARVIPTDLSSRLAIGPLHEDADLLVQLTAKELASLGFVQDSGELLHPPGSPARALQTLLAGITGAEPPSFASDVHNAILARNEELWHEHLDQLNTELLPRAAGTFSRLSVESLLARSSVTDLDVATWLKEVQRARTQLLTSPAVGASHHGGGLATAMPVLEPCPQVEHLLADVSKSFAGDVLLWRASRSELVGFGGELDLSVQMPGWTNVWTMPIQNRVDMLATGVNTTLGIRVLGRDMDQVVRASEDIASAVQKIPGAVNVLADPVRGKGYVEIFVDRDKAAEHGVSVQDVNDVIETALAGRVATTVMAGRERFPVRVRYARDWRIDEQSIAELLVPVDGLEGGAGSLSHVRLSDLADIQVSDGPATIKGENGLLRNYVRLNVRGRDAMEVVEEARLVVAQMKLPEGIHVEWTGRFEHNLRAARRLMFIVPLVIGLILLILYLTYRDFADALLMVLTVPGALAGGVFFQWLFGFNFSVTVWVGYIACFGMATATGIIMLVYLREAVERAGGLENLTLQELRKAVMTGAVHRLRPKLLTEATTIIGLAPMLWATGTGAEVIRPMAAPVLGGILIADEVIDLFLPVLFYQVRRWRWLKYRRRRSNAPAIDQTREETLLLQDA